MIDTKYTELEHNLSHIKSQLKQLSCIRNIITEGEGNMFDLVIKNADLIRVAYVRNIFESKQVACTTAQSIKSSLPSNIIGRRTVIINYETEYCEDCSDFAVCVEITGTLPQNSVYLEKTIDFSGETASLVCRENELEKAYRFITRRLEEQSCQIIGAFYEFYYDDETVELKVPIRRLSDKPVAVVADTISAFENDPQAIGKWNFIDKVPSIEQFRFEKPKYSDREHIWLKELYFLPDGQGYWIVNGWTKGLLTMSFGYPKYTCCNSYSICKQNDKVFMFIEMKDDFDTISRGGQPEIYVYEKVSDQKYTKEQIRIRDNTGFPFVLDTAVTGTWICRDFVEYPDCFSPNKQCFPQDGLFWESVSFYNNGNAIIQYKGKPSHTLKWTESLLLDTKNAIAEAYCVRNINGAEYLFAEWKSGDYLFGRRTPHWYVFERENKSNRA